MSTPVGVIKKFVKTLMETKNTGSDAIDEAFKAVGAVRYDVFKSKFQTELTNTQYYQTSGAQTFAEQACGIRINNEDTGAITGSDAGGKTTKTAESIVPETAKAVKLTDAEYNSFTKNGLTVNVTYAEKADKDVDEKFNYSGATYLEKQKLVTRALYNWWIPESLDLINQSLGINFTDGRANINKINVIFSSFNGNDSYRRYTRRDAIKIDCNYDMGFASEVDLYINADFLYNMTADDKNGVLEGDNKYINSRFYGYGSTYQSAAFTNYLDRLILQSMAEITFKANVPDTKYTEEIGMGLVELVGGYDSASTGYGLFVNPNSTSAKGYHGYGYMRYLAKNYSDGVPDGVSYNAKKTVLTISKEFTEGTLDLADFESTVKTVKASALKTVVKILGNDKANSIVSGSANDSVWGDAGIDTIYGGAGDDMLRGGKDDDYLYGEAGNDSLLGEAGNDSLYGGEGLDTLWGGKGDDMLRGGKDDDYLYGEAGNDSLLGEAGNDSLFGGEGSDTLYGGKGDDYLAGEAGNDSLLGEAGNDTLVGGAGKDVFIYTAGNDVIKDYAVGDKISVGGTISDVTLDGTNVVFTVGKNTLTVKDAADMTLTLINSKGKEYETVVSGAKTLKVTNKTSTPVTLAADVGTINASARTKAVTIVGNKRDNVILSGTKNDVLYGEGGDDSIDGGEGNDKIYGGFGADTLKGGAGNDTLIGGAGNDSLWGGTGKDVFIYTSGAGDDVIFGFDSKDTLTLDTLDFKTTYKNDVITLTFDEGSVTLKDFSTKTFHINDDVYKISGSKFVKK